MKGSRASICQGEEPVRDKATFKENKTQTHTKQKKTAQGFLYNHSPEASVEGGRSKLESPVVGATGSRCGKAVVGRPGLGYYPPPCCSSHFFLTGASPSQQQEAEERQTARPQEYRSIHVKESYFLHPVSWPPLRRQKQKPSLWVWTVSGGICDLLWGRAITPTVLGTWLVLPPHWRAEGNSWLPADPTELHTGSCTMLRSEKYFGTDSEVWLWDRQTHPPPYLKSERHFPLWKTQKCDPPDSAKSAFRNSLFSD